jgi:syntaxin 18
VSRLPTSGANPTTYLTDAQRDTLDADTKGIIRSTLTLILRLESAEKVRVQTEAQLFAKKHNSLRSIWQDESLKQTEESSMKMVTTHREGVLWYLRNRLERASEEQRERQEIRLNRQIERGKCLLHANPSMAGIKGGIRGAGAAKTAVMEEFEKDDEQAMERLSSDQLSIFEKENEGMVKHYEDTLQQVRYFIQSSTLNLFPNIPYTSASTNCKPLF